MSQFRSFGKWVKNGGYPDTTFARSFEDNSREELGASRCSGTLSSTRFSVNSSEHSGRSRNGFLRTPSLSFLFWFSVSTGPRDASPRTPSLILSLLVDAGCCVGITASCGTDVGDAGEAELEVPVDRPRTTIGTCSPCCILSVCHFYELWFLTTGPMVGVPVIFASACVCTSPL